MLLVKNDFFLIHYSTGIFIQLIVLTHTCCSEVEHEMKDAAFYLSADVTFRSFSFNLLNAKLLVANQVYLILINVLPELCKCDLIE